MVAGASTTTAPAPAPGAGRTGWSGTRCGSPLRLVVGAGAVMEYRRRTFHTHIQFGRPVASARGAQRWALLGGANLTRTFNTDHRPDAVPRRTMPGIRAPGDFAPLPTSAITDASTLGWLMDGARCGAEVGERRFDQLRAARRRRLLRLETSRLTTHRTSAAGPLVLQFFLAAETAWAGFLPVGRRQPGLSFGATAAG